MTPTRLLEELKGLTIEERLEFIESAVHLIREELEAAASAPASDRGRAAVQGRAHENGDAEAVSAEERESSLREQVNSYEARAAERRAKLDAIMGRYAFVPTSSEAFARRKQAEIELER